MTISSPRNAYTVYTGIVPGSATIFVLDESEGVGRLDLTLLEGVMIVVEVTDAGYKVCCLGDDDGMWVCSLQIEISRSHHILRYAMDQPR